MSEMHPWPVFVYGTLLSGEPNHRLLSRAKRLGEVRTLPLFELRSLGAFPGLIALGNTAVLGELYEVDVETLRSLDALEGHPSFYHRACVALENGALVEAYLLRPSQVRHMPVIVSGSWRQYRKEGRSCES